MPVYKCRSWMLPSAKKRKFLWGKIENTKLIYVAASLRSESSIFVDLRQSLSIFVVVRRWRQQQRRRRRILYHVSVYRSGGIGGPPHRIYVSPSDITELFPRGDMISLLYSQQYRGGLSRGGKRGRFGLIWSREEVQVAFRRKRCGVGRGDTLLFLPLILGSMRRSLIVKDSSVGNFHETQDI